MRTNSLPLGDSTGISKDLCIPLTARHHCQPQQSQPILIFDLFGDAYGDLHETTPHPNAFEICPVLSKRQVSLAILVLAHCDGDCCCKEIGSTQSSWCDSVHLVAKLFRFRISCSPVSREQFSALRGAAEMWSPLRAGLISHVIDGRALTFRRHLLGNVVTLLPPIPGCQVTDSRPPPTVCGRNEIFGVVR